MCGLVGMFGNLWSNDEKVFSELLQVSKFRGPHSTGVGWARSGGKGAPNWIKSAGPPEKLMSSDRWKEFSGSIAAYSFVMGHNRYATMGNVVGKNAHPFCHGNILLAHNGGISNPKALTGQDFEVDSEHAAWLMNNKGAKYTLEHVQGDFTFTWYNWDDKTFNLVRNVGRPLWVAKNNKRNIWYYASESGMLEWILTRNGVDFDAPQQPPAGMVLSWSQKHPNQLFSRMHVLATENWRNNAGVKRHWDAAAAVEQGFSKRDEEDLYSNACSIVEISTAAARRNAANESVGGARTPIEIVSKIENRGRILQPQVMGDKFLKDHQLSEGDYIRGSFYKFEEYDNKRRSGQELRGKAIGSPLDPVLESMVAIVAHNLNLQEYLNPKNNDFKEGLYFGKIRSCYWSRADDSYVITLDDLNIYTDNDIKDPRLKSLIHVLEDQEEVKQPPLVPPAFAATVEAVNITPAATSAPELSTTTESPSDESIHGKIETGEFEEAGADDVVPAWRGELISMQDWEQRTYKGCSLCGSPIAKTEILSMAWNHEREPFCTDCVVVINSNSGWGFSLTPVSVESDVQVGNRFSRSAMKIAFKAMEDGVRGRKESLH